MEFIHEKIDIGYDTLDRAEHSDGRRYLTLDGVAYPSVTTVLSILGEEKIAAWKAKVGEAKAEQIGKVARERGTAVHSIVEKYLKNEDTSDFLPHIKQSLENLKPLFHRGFGKIYGNEVPLYSDHLKLAGTCDCIAEWHGVPSVVDFKTSNGIFDTHIIQVAAYAKALEEQLLAIGNPPEKAEVKEAYVVRFSKFHNEYEVKRVANIDESFNAFKACLFLWHYKQKNQMESV